MEKKQKFTINRKLISAFIVVFAAVSFVSLWNKYERIKTLKNGVEMVNKKCPIDVGVAGKIIAVNYADKNVELIFVINDLFTDIQAMRDQPDLVKNKLKVMYQNPEDGFREMLQLIAEIDGSMTCTYIGQTSGEKTNVVFTRDDVRSLLKQKAPIENSLAQLTQMIEDPFARFPIKVDDVTTMTHMFLSDSAVVYQYEIYEAGMAMTFADFIADYGEAMKESTAQSLLSDPSSRILITLCVDCDRGIHYRYTGDVSGMKYEFRFTPEELKSFITNNES
ncbi:MAG: hypothetical protein LBM62_01255 [Mediterranea sp.]|nr:hypothetical protein [Mediterranea sp.]